MVLFAKFNQPNIPNAFRSPRIIASLHSELVEESTRTSLWVRLVVLEPHALSRVLIIVSALLLFKPALTLLVFHLAQ